MSDPEKESTSASSERRELLTRLEGWLEVPMLVLGFAWMTLLIWEFTWGLSPLLEALGTAIWIVFILNFAIEIILAPHKLEYLKRNWLTALSLLVPALRVFRVVRVLRVARAARGLRRARSSRSRRSGGARRSARSSR